MLKGEVNRFFSEKQNQPELSSKSNEIETRETWEVFEKQLADGDKINEMIKATKALDSKQLEFRGNKHPKEEPVTTCGWCQLI